MKRREFFNIACMFSGAILLPFNKLFGKNFLRHHDERIWTELIDYARWCPSPHNVQPWKMKLISKKEAHLYYDPKRIPAVVDDKASFTTVGMGMFIECLNIVASSMGFKVITEHAPEKEMDTTAKEFKLFSKLYLVETNEKSSYDRELIKQRKTSRLQYDGRVIDPSIITALTAVSNQNGHNFFYSSDKGLIDYSIELNNETVLIRSDEKETREEMSKWIRTTDKEAEEKKDGLWYRGTGTSGKMTHNFFFHHERFAKGWKRRESLRILNKTMRGTGNLAWISGPFENRNDWVQTGVMLQRLWLEMTKHNVYMHPFGTVVTTPAACEKFKQKINYDESNGTLWFLVRLGYSKEPPRSFRLDTKDILMT